MAYLWWAVVVMLYIMILVTYGLISKLLLKDGESSVAADAVFFAVASVITISAIPLINGNLK
jgi:hypothetical protein